MRTISPSTKRKGSLARRAPRAIHRFEGDTKDAVLDSILDFSLQALFPFLGDDNHAELRIEVADHLRTHLGTELAIIKGSCPEESTSPMVLRLRKRFARR